MEIEITCEKCGRKMIVVRPPVGSSTYYRCICGHWNYVEGPSKRPYFGMPKLKL